MLHLRLQHIAASTNPAFYNLHFCILMSAARCTKRLVREYEDTVKGVAASSGAYSLTLKDPQNLMDTWSIGFYGAPGTLYAGEHYVLQFKFDGEYPIAPPQVTFADPAPIHPHIYSSGLICLSILADNWSPALRVLAIVESILSMLSSCTAKVRPHAHDQFVKAAPRGTDPRRVKWHFDDDSV
jgi:ubiquitin-conjugating enzyme E2 W